MKNKNFTLMIVPDARSKVRRIQLRKGLVYGALLGVLGGIAILGAVLVHYTYIVSETFEARALRDENSTLQERVKELQSKVETVDERLAELGKFEQQIREMTQLNDDGRGFGMGPVQADLKGASPLTTVIDPFAVQLKPEDPAARQLRDALLDSRLAGLAHEANSQVNSLSSLVEYFERQKALLATIPSIWPARGWVTSGYGARNDPYTGERVMHAGVDIAAEIGAKVIAPASGLVTHAGPNGAYGNMIRIDHGNGLVTHYGHLNSILVKVGDEVERGQHMGGVGNTGRSTGPHLHYEVRQDKMPIDPKSYILQ